MLMTGAGSPTGMQVYEGDLLPSIFHGQPLHCDAGPNVVRGYITQPDGAGYKAEIVNILEGTKNRWFRPSDVAVAPDGSLIVADWYDPGVGGHGMGDVTRGRLFRVTTKAAEKYQVPDVKAMSDLERVMRTLIQSPNEDARYQAWQMFTNNPAPGADELRSLFEDKMASPQYRARALWMLASLCIDESTTTESAAKALEEVLISALTDDDPNIRITALRTARRLWQQKQPETLREVIAKVVADKSPAVRRDAAIALRFDGSDVASIQWAGIAAEAKTFNRWEIEALGIALDWFPKERWAACNEHGPVEAEVAPWLLWRITKHTMHWTGPFDWDRYVKTPYSDPIALALEVSPL
jgi:hypothetical protein